MNAMCCGFGSMCLWSMFGKSEVGNVSCDDPGGKGKMILNEYEKG